MDPLDAKLPAVLDDLLAERLDHETFESVVAEYWASGRFIRVTPDGTAARMREWVAESPASGQYLFGEPGQPGAVHLAGPRKDPHAHETGRIAVVTRGRAVFHVHRRIGGRDFVVEAPVSEGDAIFWPPWQAHVFVSAESGFALFCAMGQYASPEDERFHGLPELEQLPRIAYSSVLEAV